VKKKATVAEKPKATVARETFTAEDQGMAEIPGFAGARFWSDSSRAFLDATKGAAGVWLTLSGGGEEGAYGAGVLTGMSAAGQRPDFSVVIGVSTGALMAPYAYLGTPYDAALKSAYTTISAADVFEAAGTRESLVDAWPLQKLIEKAVTPELLAAVAVEHAKGRKLFIGTTNLDAGRSVVWDMGAIASRGNEAALKLFREVLLASSSIPGFFQPVMIEAVANGKVFHEMHADGTIRAPIYVAPEAVLRGIGGARLPASELYVIVNSKLAADFQVSDRSTTAILGRSISLALKAGLTSEIARIHAAAQRQGTNFQLAAVAPEFNHPSRGAFDPDYMRALFDLGLKHGQAATAFRPDPSNQAHSTTAMHGAEGGAPVSR
jgi:hypothetical protein